MTGAMPDDDDDDDDDDDPTTGADDTTTGDDDDDESGGIAFIVDPDGGICFQGPHPEGVLFHCQCDVWAQDCPDGEKCVPWANDGGTQYNATRCVGVVEEPAAAGEPCTSEAPYSALDDCAFGTICLGSDGEGMAGTCTPQCGGNEAFPECDAGTDCLIAGYGALAVCRPTCDPLLLDCPDDQVCIPSETGFVCLPPAPPHDEDEGCFLDSCAPGSICVAGDELVPCEADGCCTPVCDLDDPDFVCPAEGQICRPWYPDRAPEGLEHVGACALEPR